MITIDISAAECASGRSTASHHDQAVHALQTDGFVVLNDIVKHEHLAILRERMLSDVAAILAGPDVPFNFNRSNIQQGPPPHPPYLFRDVLLNDIVIAVTKALLGPGLKNGFYSGNTALPGDYPPQPTHVDLGHLWPGMPTATPPYGLVVNIPVVDMSPHNGSTELWPGSHLDTRVAIQQHDITIPADTLAARRAVAPPIQPMVRAGSVLIRDIRLWHGGMPNHSATPRPMIAMIHWVSWWPSQERPSFPLTSQAFFKHPELHTDANFVDMPLE